MSIYDKHGDFKSSFALPGYADGILLMLSFNYVACRLCTSLDWDKDGDLLAATQERSGEMLIYY